MIRINGAHHQLREILPSTQDWGTNVGEYADTEKLTIYIQSRSLINSSRNCSLKSSIYARTKQVQTHRICFFLRKG